MELAEKFQVGRNCIREATKSLAVSGILEARPGQGTFVSPVALRKIMAYELFDYMNEERAWIELMQVRAALEGIWPIWLLRERPLKTLKNWKR